MPDRPARPCCGNDPRAQLTDGDRQAVADSRAYLAARAERRKQYGDLLRRWGLLDEVNDPRAAEEFVVTDLLALVDAERAAGHTAPPTDLAACTAAIYDALAGLQGGPHHLSPGTRQAVAEHLAATLPFVPTPQSPADRSVLHGQLVSALDTAFRSFVSPLSDAVPEGVELSDHLADAVLTVLPEPADRAVVRAEALRMAEMALRERASHLTGEFNDSDILHEDGPAATVATWTSAADLVRRLAGEQPQADGPAAQRPAGLTVPALARLLAGGAALAADAPPYDQLPDAERERYLGEARQLLDRADGGQQP